MKTAKEILFVNTLNGNVLLLIKALQEEKAMAADNCEMCGYLEYNEELEYYECTMNLDEDEMYNLLPATAGNVRISI